MKIDIKKVELELARQCLSVPELATKVGVNRETVRNLFRRRGQASYKLTGNLARALGLPVEAIVEDAAVAET